MKDDGLENMAHLITAWQSDPVLFVRQAFKVEPTKQQTRVLEAVCNNFKISAVSGHGTGKSANGAFLIWWFLTCFPHSRIPCTAPTAHQLKDILWAEAMKWGQQLDPWIREQFEIGADTIYNKKYPKTWFAAARTSRKESPDALQGFHADNLLFIIDEASGVPQEIFEPVEGTLTGLNNKILIQGNPTKTTGFLFDSHYKDKNRWSRLCLSSKNSPLVTQEYIDGMAERYGEDSDIYRVRVLGQFPSASVNQLIPRWTVERAQAEGVLVNQYGWAPVVLGVDIARFGDDRSVIACRQGIKTHWVRKYNNVDTMGMASHVAAAIGEVGARMVMIDEGAMGAGVIDRLKQLGYTNVEGVNFGSQGDTGYTNKRSEMWGRMADWLSQEGVDIPNDADVHDDLIGPEYGFDNKEQVQLEKKVDMKKRGLSSPDCGDAIALTFAVPAPKVLKHNLLRPSVSHAGAGDDEAGY